MTRYIVVTGGVISGLGKGVVTASIGNLLKSSGYKVTSIKIDPYINVDAGTMRPTEHGEVFVTDDGGETDQDIGTYERFLDVSLSKKNSLTTGQIYLKVINDERSMKYKGKCVEVIPHIPHEVERRITEAGKGNDFVLVEVGGTAGDYQNVLFLDAFRIMKLKEKSIMFVHVVYLPIPNNLGEMKTKPAQMSVRALNANGIQPDMIMCRSSVELDSVRRDKLSLFTNIKTERIISAPDVNNIYEVPSVFSRHKVLQEIFSYFNIKKKPKVSSLNSLVKRIKSIKRTVKVGIIGKYFDIGNFSLVDSYLSVIEAAKHACWKHNVNPEIVWIDSKEFEKDRKKLRSLDKLHAIIIPGGFGSSGVEGKIRAIEYARKNHIPFLGLCYGMQLAVIEYARNVCGLEGANSSEINSRTDYKIVDILKEQIKKMQDNDYGGSMRLGAWPAKLVPNTKVWGLYGRKTLVHERHRHRYEINPEFIEVIEKKGLVFSGKSPDRRLMEFLELPAHPYFVATQAHPELKSRPLKPSPLFDGLIKAAKCPRLALVNEC